MDPNSHAYRTNSHFTTCQKWSVCQKMAEDGTVLDSWEELDDKDVINLVISCMTQAGYSQQIFLMNPHRKYR